MELNNKTQTDIVNYLGVSKSTVSDWCKGKKAPRMDKIDKLCELFNSSRSDLMDANTATEKNSYYFDKETAEMADQIKNNKELSLLFDAARDVDSEDLKIVHEMLLRLKRSENQ